MSNWVIDASVLCKVLVPEDMSDKAEGLILHGGSLHAPDLLLVEVANVMWKHVRRGRLDASQANARLMRASLLDVRLAPVQALVYPALDVALLTQRAVYDCCHLALAQILNLSVVTADRKLVNSLSGTAFSNRVVWLGDL